MDNNHGKDDDDDDDYYAPDWSGSDDDVIDVELFVVNWRYGVNKLKLITNS